MAVNWTFLHLHPAQWPDSYLLWHLLSSISPGQQAIEGRTGGLASTHMLSEVAVPSRRESWFCLLRAVCHNEPLLRCLLFSGKLAMCDHLTTWQFCWAVTSSPVHWNGYTTSYQLTIAHATGTPGPFPKCYLVVRNVQRIHFPLCLKLGPWESELLLWLNS